MHTQTPQQVVQTELYQFLLVGISLEEAHRRMKADYLASQLYFKAQGDTSEVQTFQTAMDYLDARVLAASNPVYAFAVGQLVLFDNPAGYDVKNGMVLTLEGRGYCPAYGPYYQTPQGRIYELSGCLSTTVYTLGDITLNVGFWDCCQIQK